MHRSTVCRLLILCGVLASTWANAACVDPALLARSTASIVQNYDERERDAHPGIIGVQGTGWFLSPTIMVTAEHVATAMKLSTTVWKPLEIAAGDGSELIGARIQRRVGGTPEKLAVIELQRAASDARSVAIRKEPLVPEEQVMTLAYPAGSSRPVGGRFVRFGEEGKLAGMVLLEMYEGENRLVIDHGASGAPVVDCNGRVAAVITNVLSQSLKLASREIRFSTAWGMPNVVSVPVQVLEEVK
ncbi:trypsin-like peptidase domain-containing protein [Bradyrhizobium sp. CCGB12]|uniref:S1 family peptidase n=1 Tax=Bradyrhizobium sp. CCGB12 TaxID=2949632 RepID=UPI0020B43FF1|nr:serine protease [Bradyrhizobium sp. CCGB12]MCP3393656.1 trypsin-like peptidase domain-containing protein [Bradyrhizobium sp. CCGB12]